MSGDFRAIRACLEKFVLHQKLEDSHGVQYDFCGSRGFQIGSFANYSNLYELRTRFGGGGKSPVVKEMHSKEFCGAHLWDRLLYSSHPPVDSNVMQSEPGLDSLTVWYISLEES